MVRQWQGQPHFDHGNIDRAATEPTELNDPPTSAVGGGGAGTATRQPADQRPASVTSDSGMAAGPRRRQRLWWDGFRPLLLRLHFYVGVFVGPFVLLAAVSGLVYALTPQLEQLIYHRQLTVPVGTTTVPIAEQIQAAQQAVPDGSLVEVRSPSSADGTTRVSFSTPRMDADHARTAFIDPYSGQVRGVLTTWGEWLPLRSWVDTFHRTLMLGNLGRVYSELAASWLWVLAVSGLGIWLVRNRRRHRIRRMLLPTSRGRGRGRLLTWHGTIGLWAAIGMLFLSATGLTWSQFAGAHVSQLRTKLDWTTPSAVTTLPPASTDSLVTKADQPAAVERVLETARDQAIDGMIVITPGQPGQAWTAAQGKRSWPEQHDTIAVDPSTGRMMDRVDFTDWPFAAKLAQWGIDAHMGLLFGVANQIALAGLAAGLIGMIIVGYRMWWLRRPTRIDRSQHLAATLGASQTPSRVALLTIGGIAIVVGVVAPVLGGSLLIFLTIDAIRTAVTVAPATARGGSGTRQGTRLS